MFNSVYYFAEHERWAPWFGNPNYDGTFLATLLAYANLMRGTFASKWRYTSLAAVGFVILEAILLVGIVYTYSRSSLLAVSAFFLLDFVFCLYKFCRCGYWGSKGVGLLFGLNHQLVRSLVLFFSLIVTGAWDRVDLNYIRNDPSVLNRLDLWIDGLKIASNRPWKGVGVNFSGAFYINWYQPIEEELVVHSLVNGYLTTLAEQGIFVAALPIFILTSALSLVIGLTRANKENISTLVFIGVILILSVSLFFTDYTEESLVYIPGLIGYIFIIYSTRILGAICFPMIGKALLLTFMLLSLTLACGALLRMGDDTDVSITDQYVLVSNQSTDSNYHVQVLPDDRVLGRYSGRQVRKMLDSVGRVSCSPWKFGDTSFIKLQDVDLFLVFGGKHALFGKEKTVHPNLCIVHPIGEPSGVLSGVRLLVLPGYDTSLGEREKWIQWARQYGIEIMVSPNVGIDLRLKWQEIFNEILTKTT